ncbi:MAG: hypothetical protein DMG69_19965 [Acidobacteria bacterium]|nr:MAG: hypothetical protein DMG69_19965 [Acidobacteriota bacterium]
MLLGTEFIMDSRLLVDCLHFAFPQLYASSFSGFYLPRMMVLWLLMLRAIGIEFRVHIPNPVWESFFDANLFPGQCAAGDFLWSCLRQPDPRSALGPDGYFFEPLWTNWRVGPNPGILDWCTVLAGLVALAAIAVHGALYVAVKTEAALAARACGLAVTVSPVPSLLTVASLAATALVRPTVMNITGNIRSAFSCPLSSSGHWPP